LDSHCIKFLSQVSRGCLKVLNKFTDGSQQILERASRRHSRVILCNPRETLLLKAGAGAERWPQANKEYEYYDIKGNSTQLLHTKNMALGDDAVKCSEVSICIQWVSEIKRFISIPAKEIRFYGNSLKSNILQSIDQIYIYIFFLRQNEEILNVTTCGTSTDHRISNGYN